MVFLWCWTGCNIDEAKWQKTNVFLPIWPSRVNTTKNQLHKIRLFSLDSECFRGFFQLPEVFCKKDVLKNFTKFKWKHLCQNLFFNKVSGTATLLKKRFWHRCFPVNFVKFLRAKFLQNTSGYWEIFEICSY